MIQEILDLTQICSRYQIVFWDGFIENLQKLYDTADTALKVAVGTVKTVIGY